MTATTSEILAQALDAAGLPELAARARVDEFHEYLSPHALPLSQLIHELHSTKNAEAIKLARRVADGEIDASSEEADEWAASEEGQATFKEFLGKGKPE